MMTKWMAKGYLWLLLALLYSPILIIMIFSFTEAKVLGNWTGFSTKLYSSLFTGGVQRSLVSVMEYVRHCDDCGDRLHAVG